MKRQRLVPPDQPLEPSAWDAERIVLLRHRLGWTQAQLGHRLLAGRQAVSKWERGEATPLPVFESLLDELERQLHQQGDNGDSTHPTAGDHPG